MSKYNQHDPRNMSKFMLRLKQSGDQRYLKFVLAVAVQSGTSPHYVEQKILEFTNTQ